MAHFPCTCGCQAQKADSPDLQVMAAEQPLEMGWRVGVGVLWEPEIVASGCVSGPVSFEVKAGYGVAAQEIS